VQESESARKSERGQKKRRGRVREKKSKTKGAEGRERYIRLWDDV